MGYGKRALGGVSALALLAWAGAAHAQDEATQVEELTVTARRQAETDGFADTYRQHRPMIERTIAWLVKDNNRRLRYRGIEANRLGWSHRCAAVNLKRLLALGLDFQHGWTISPA